MPRIPGRFDAADFCDGATAACTADAKLTSECRGSAGACDVAEVCDGVANNCPTDALEPVTTVCRPALGTCDPEESCDGASTTCPGDEVASAGIACSSGDECSIDEICDDAGLCIGGRLSVPAPDSCPVIDNSVYFADAARDVVVGSNLVFVAALGSGLRIEDFSDPEDPVEIASYDPPTCLDDGVPVPFEAQDVELSESLLLVSAGACGVLVFDTNFASTIDDSTRPIVIDTDGEALGAQRRANEIFAADFGGGVAVLDLFAEQQIGSFGAGDPLYGDVVDIEIDGDRAIIAAGPGLRIVGSISQMDSLIGAYDAGNDANGFSQDSELVGSGDVDLVYLARSLDGLDVLDISDPSQITLLKNIPSMGGSYEVSISGSRAVTAEGDEGIGVLDLTNPSAPEPLGTFESEGFTSDVEISQGFAFIAFETEQGGEGGLRIVQLERVGVDPLQVPEPRTVIGQSICIATIGGLMRRRRQRQR